jgi:hypothetical protein
MTSTATALMNLGDLPADSQRAALPDFLLSLEEHYTNKPDLDDDAPPAAAAEDTTRGWMCLVDTDAKWASRLGNIITAAVIGNPAADPPIPDVPAEVRERPTGARPVRPPANATTTTVAFYKMDDDRSKAYREAAAIAKTEFLVAIGPTLIAAIRHPKTGTNAMQLPQLITALTAHLGKYTNAEITALKAELLQPIACGFKTHLTRHITVHAMLTAAKQTVNEHDKLEYYATSTAAHPGITDAKAQWLRDVPQLEDQTFEALADYLRTQEPNITAAPSLARIG